MRDAERGLGVREDVIPEARLEMALHFRQVEIWPAAAREQLLRVVEKEEAEIEERAGNRLAALRLARGFA